MASITNVCCAFCQGKGKDPFGLLSELSVCQVCLGKGCIPVATPCVSCPACGGCGVAHGTRLVCAVCGGKGVISPQKKEHWLATLLV
jgi:hypothetical protein